MDKHLHIITHEIPWPVVHGGHIDLFYKLQSLHKAGIKIHLHCFSSGLRLSPGLEPYCKEIHVYRRKTGLGSLSLHIPYIVNSRRCEELMKRLSEDNYPILFEGVHVSWNVYRNHLNGRKMMLRLHNVEWKYYKSLGMLETNFIKKAYFLFESYLLRRYEAVIAQKVPIAAVSKSDADHYKNIFNAPETLFLPAFIPWGKVKCTGKGTYCLYHGNLSVNENIKAAKWLLENVLGNVEIPFIIAGKNPPEDLVKLCSIYRNCQLIADPSEETMHRLISDAHIHLIPSFNNTGVKLKLLNALFNGNHCIVNNAAIEGSGLKNCCAIAETAGDFKSKIDQLMKQTFSTGDAMVRQQELSAVYNNDQNARELITWIY